MKTQFNPSVKQFNPSFKKIYIVDCQDPEVGKDSFRTVTNLLETLGEEITIPHGVGELGKFVFTTGPEADEYLNVQRKLDARGASFEEETRVIKSLLIDFANRSTAIKFDGKRTALVKAAIRQLIGG